MASIFTRIINGELPCWKIAEDADYFAFLDIRPTAKGHTLVVPKKEVDNIFDLDDETLAGQVLFAKRVAKALAKALPCKRVGMLVIGTEVPHAHIHLIPFQEEKQMNISAPKLDLPKEEMEKIAAAARGAFE